MTAAWPGGSLSGRISAPDTSLKVSLPLALIQKKSIEAAGLTPAGVYGLSVKRGHGFGVIFMTTRCVAGTASGCTHKDKLHFSVLPFKQRRRS